MNKLVFIWMGDTALRAWGRELPPQVRRDRAEQLRNSVMGTPTSATKGKKGILLITIRARAMASRLPSRPAAFRRLLAGLGVAVASISLAAAQSANAVATSKHINLSGVTLNLGAIFATEEQQIEASGVLDGAPYKISWSVFPSPSPVLAAVQSGALDAGINLGDAGVELADASGTPWTAADAPIKVIGVYPTVHPDIETIATTASGITKLSQIKGKSFVYDVGGDTEEEYLFDLTYEHLTPADVTPIIVPAADLVSTFQSGNGQVFAGPATSFLPLIDSGAARVISTSKQVGVPALGAVIANSASLANPAKAAALKDFMGRLTEFWVWYSKHISQDATIQETAADVPAQYSTAIAVAGEGYLVPITKSIVTEEQTAANALHTAGTIDTGINVAPLFDTAFNSEVIAAEKKYGVPQGAPKPKVTSKAKGTSKPKA
ncbi:MAG: hypothetical protein ABSC56_11565 [Solirubrobacteraceae bacterium]|jgi:sulfonate transport system substrate-binding protein